MLTHSRPACKAASARANPGWSRWRARYCGRTWRPRTPDRFRACLLLVASALPVQRLFVCELLISTRSLCARRLRAARRATGCSSAQSQRRRLLRKSSSPYSLSDSYHVTSPLLARPFTAGAHVIFAPAARARLRGRGGRSRFRLRKRPRALPVYFALVCLLVCLFVRQAPSEPVCLT